MHESETYHAPNKLPDPGNIHTPEFKHNEENVPWNFAEALAALFQQFAAQVKCVVLNACYSEAQAKAIVRHIDYVIGMHQEITDAAALLSVSGSTRPWEPAVTWRRLTK